MRYLSVRGGRYFRVIFLITLLPKIANSKESTLVEEKEVICSSDKMVVNLSFKHPFNGIIFVQNHFSSAECRWRGNGGHNLLVILPIGNKPAICGIQHDQNVSEHSATLVISPDDTVLTHEAFALTVRCVQNQKTKDLVLTLGSPSLETSFRILHTDPMAITESPAPPPPALSISVLEGHGITGKALNEAMVGQRITLDVQLRNTSKYDMFVKNCVAHDGTHNPEAMLGVVDSKGCAVRLPRAIDAPVLISSPYQNSSKHIYVHMYGFQFTSSEFAHFECQVRTCHPFPCSSNQCDDESAVDSPKSTTFLLNTVLQITPHKLAMAQVQNVEETMSDSDGDVACSDIAWTILIVLMVFLTLSITFIGLQKLLPLCKRFYMAARV